MPIKCDTGYFLKILPCFTTVEIAAIANPATGTIVFDTTLVAVYVYNGAAWAAV
jgi:hypothetical protein